MVAFWAREFVNAYVLARMKVWTAGRWLWARTIGSTVVGEGVDSLLFYPLAFLGAPGFTPTLVAKLVLVQWALKVGWDVVLTPVTYAAVGWLKRAERVDVYDRATDSRRSGRAFDRRRTGALSYTGHFGYDDRRSFSREPASFLCRAERLRKLNNPAIARNFRTSVQRIRRTGTVTLHTSTPPAGRMKNASFRFARASA